jgi:mono/diheme cytochrome c family protein
VRKGILLALACSVVLGGCHTDMWLMPRADIQGKSTFFADGMDSRPKVPGTVAIGKNLDDPSYSNGKVGREFTPQVPATRAQQELGLKNYEELVKTGRELYDALCSPCHGRLGDGQGMIAQRGFAVSREVSTYHTERLRKMPDGYIFDVISNGYGAMYPMKAKMSVPERWAIVTYVRALQRAQAPQSTNMEELR